MDPDFSLIFQEVHSHDIEQILATLFAQFFCQIIIYGGYVRDRIRGDIPYDMDIMVKSANGNNILTNLAELKAYLQLIGIINPAKQPRAQNVSNGDNTVKPGKQYYHERWLLSISQIDFLADISTYVIEQSCDMTANNFFLSNDNLFIRCPDPTGRYDDGKRWFSKCRWDASMRDIVPMCDPILIEPLTVKSSLRIIRKRFIIIERVIKMMQRGWKLSSHLNGRELQMSLVKEGGNKCCHCQTGINGFYEGLFVKCCHSIHLVCLEKMIFEAKKVSEIQCSICQKRMTF